MKFLDIYKPIRRTSYPVTSILILGLLFYFLHPLYSKEVTVVDEHNYNSQKVSQKVDRIQFFDNSVVRLPAWMTDAEYCSSCILQEQPGCSLASLRQLRMLLDGLAL